MATKKKAAKKAAKKATKRATASRDSAPSASLEGRVAELERKVDQLFELIGPQGTEVTI